MRLYRFQKIMSILLIASFVFVCGFVSVAKAVSYTSGTYELELPDSFAPVLINSYKYSSSNYDRIETYEYSVIPKVAFNVPAGYNPTSANPYYLNGYVAFSLNTKIASNSYYTNANEQEVTYYMSDDESIRVLVQQWPNLYGVRVYVYFGNYKITSSRTYLPMPVFTVKDSLYVGNYSSGSEYIRVPSPTVSMSDIFATSSLPAEPADNAFSTLMLSTIKRAIDSSSDIDSIVGYLYTISNSDTQLFNTVLANLPTIASTTSSMYTFMQNVFNLKLSDVVANLHSDHVETYNFLVQLSGSLAQYLNNIVAKDEQIRSLLDLFKIQQASFNSQLIALLQSIYFGDDSTEAQNAMADQSQAMESIGNALDVSRPNANNVVNAGDSFLTPELGETQGDVFFFMSSPYVLPILIFTFTVAILSYVLYGKIS